MKSLPKFRLTADHILYAVALANSVRIGWAYAFVDAGGNLLSAPGLAGALLGAVLSLGTAFVAGKIPALKAKARVRLTWISLALILVLEPVILAPITVTHMPAALQTTLPGGWKWLWGVTAALLPSLVLAAISFSNGSLVEGSAASEEKPARSEPKPAKSEPEPAKEPEKPAFSCHCGYIAKSQAALNAHQAKHKPAEADVVGYVASFEPIKKDKQQ
jgi:hypothetical protein